ncbi:FHA domain-containing protein [Zhihengliuella flava]|uniref:FHA domain-containing protein n=1 Tax=Zhihengliuella flava TaxID=1285193 RepID=A0A931D3U5_9MICC|nr:hypothetical protein [Zhihengliuella flava]
MTAVHYRPGDRWALVTHRHVVVLPAEAEGDLLVQLWEQMAEATVESLLSAILSAYKMQISRLPDFAIIARQSPPHVVVRGDVTIRVPDERGGSSTSGEGAATWHERRFLAGAGWHVESPDAGQDAWLPIGEGVVRVSEVRDVAEAGTPPLETAVQHPEPAPHAEVAEPPAEEQPAPEDESPAEPVPEAQPPSGPAAAPEPTPEPEPVSEVALPLEPAAAYPEADDVEVDSLSWEHVSLEQVSLAGEILGPREPLEDSAALADSLASGGEPDADDPDEANTILVNRPAGVPAHPAASGPSSASPVGAAEAESPVVRAPRRGPAAPEPAPADAPGMIDSVPWRTGDAPRAASAESAPHASSAQPEPAAGGRGPVEEGDHDGETVHRSALPTPVPSAEPDDGLTLTGHDTTAAANAGEFVLGRACADGHANPPTATTCTTCGAALSGDAHQVMRPPLGKMTVIEGSGARTHQCPLVRSVVLGRQPSARGFSGDAQPKLMQVSSPAGDISRSHLQVKVDGWHVDLVDLGATNGTVLIRPGQAPRRLGRNESVLLLDGDIADLGDGVSLRFEDLP